MDEPDVFVNQDTGETLTLAGYIDQQRDIEREITRLDVAIETHREALKACKDGREKAVRDLRATVREIKILGAKRRGAAKRAKRRVETSPR